jgi:hypothetical protein
MKLKYLLVLAVVVLAGCASAKKNDYCVHLDDSLGFARCETAEVVCYTSNGGMPCWPKPAPSPQAAQAKAPAPKAKPAK